MSMSLGSFFDIAGVVGSVVSITVRPEVIKDKVNSACSQSVSAKQKGKRRENLRTNGRKSVFENFSIILASTCSPICVLSKSMFTL
jgi:hypothetical protein